MLISFAKRLHERNKDLKLNVDNLQDEKEKLQNKFQAELRLSEMHQRELVQAKHRIAQLCAEIGNDINLELDHMQ